MRKEILFLVAFILLGCVQTQKTETGREVVVEGKGISVDISVSPSETFPGSPVTVEVNVKNTGDFDMVVKKVEILGQVASLRGDLSEETEETIVKGGSYPFIFNPKISENAKGEIEIFPAVCYEYKTEGSLTIYITSDYSIYSNSSITSQEESSNSPIEVSFYHGRSVYLARKEGDEYVATITDIRISPKTKQGMSWPVMDCLSNETKIVKVYKVRIDFPKDYEEIKLINGASYFEGCENGRVEKDDILVEDIGLGYIECDVNEVFRKYYERAGIRYLPVQVELVKDAPISLDSIKITVFMKYDYYEFLRNMGVKIKVLEVT